MINSQAEQAVGDLRLLKEGRRGVRLLTPKVVEMDRPASMEVRSHGHHAGVAAAADGVVEDAAQCEVAEVGRGELRFETLWGELPGREHHPGLSLVHIPPEPFPCDPSGTRPAW